MRNLFARSGRRKRTVGASVVLFVKDVNVASGQSEDFVRDRLSNARLYPCSTRIATYRSLSKLHSIIPAPASSYRWLSLSARSHSGTRSPLICTPGGDTTPVSVYPEYCRMEYRVEGASGLSHHDDSVVGGLIFS